MDSFIYSYSDLLHSLFLDLPQFYGFEYLTPFPQNVIDPDIIPPENIKVPIEPIIANQPDIVAPENIQVPVEPIIANQPDIVAPENIQVPVESIISNQPDIITPENIQVPVEPIIANQPDIVAPENVQYYNEPIFSRQLEVTDSENENIYQNKSISDIAYLLDVSSEDLKYLRGAAEQYYNQYVDAEFTIEQNNTNNISSNLDFDSVVSGLTDAVNEAVEIIAEGVHS